MLKGDCSSNNSPYNAREDTRILRSPIKIMVIDQHKDSLAYVGDFLKSHSFEVTCVDHAGAALRILSEKKVKFDLLYIDSDVKDVDIHTFLRLIKDMDLLSIVMHEEEDDDFLLAAFRNGAFFVSKRPLTVDEVWKARKHVMRERIKKFDQFRMFHDYENTELESASGMDLRKDNNDASKNVRESNVDNSSDVHVFENNIDGTRKKICIEWTKELHSKFLKAVFELGEGRCFPKDILETMGVPGLTKKQVASHLQKCRRDGWISSGRRGTLRSLQNDTVTNNVSQGVDSRRFGRLPPVAKHIINQQERILHIDATSPSYRREMNAHDMNSQPPMDYSLINYGFGFQNNKKLFPITTKGGTSNQHSFPQNQTSDDSLGFQNNVVELFSVPTVGQTSNQPSFIPNQVSGDYLDFQKDVDELFPTPSTVRETSKQNSIPPYLASGDYRNFLNDANDSIPASCLELGALDWSYNFIPDQISRD